MRILVTGSSGFLGREVVRRLRELGHYVIGFDREPSLDGDRSAPELFFQVDLTSRIPTPIPHFERCIHLASDVGGFLYNANTQDLVDVERAMIGSVTECCRAVECGRVIYLSSINVFEGGDEYCHGPIRVASQVTPYARAKALGEAIIQESFPEFVIIRPTNVFGVGQKRSHIEVGQSHVIPDLLLKIDIGTDYLEVLGTGEQVRNFIHVTDVTEFLCRVIDAPVKGWFNLRSQITLRIGELAQELMRLRGVTRRVVFSPRFMEYEGRAFAEFDISTVAALGWRPKVLSIVEGLSANRP